MSVPRPAATFDASAVRAFRYVHRTFDPGSGVAAFRYALDDLDFEERFTFPVPARPLAPARLDAVDRVLRHLFVAAGTSYYKAAAPPTVVVEHEPLSDDDVAVYERLYRLGLAEYAFENRLAGWDAPRFEVADTAPPPPVSGLGLAPRPLVPLGGGKDSVVALEALRAAGHDPVLLTVNRPAAIDAVVAASGLDALLVRRELDPRLHEVTAAGGRNGHVPVTAIVSLASIAAALLNGFDSVVMANERSASIPNLVWSGLTVNHQYSKSLDFERDLRGIVARDVTPELEWFSLLRPFSELRVVRAFAALPQYRGVITSCNTAFRLDPARRGTGWCNDCPKCRFVFLTLACFAPRAEVLAMFGHDLLDDPAQTEGFLALCGIEADKPLECVGEVEESRAAAQMLLARDEWRGARVLAALDTALTPGLRVAPDAVEALLAASPEHCVPARFRGALDAVR